MVIYDGSELGDITEEVIYDKSRGYSCKSNEALIYISDMINTVCGQTFIILSKPKNESWFFNSNSCCYFIPIWAIKKVKKAKVKK